MSSARHWIEKLGLAPHPEGGYFRQTYQAPVIIPKAALPSTFHGDRSSCTAIYFLLQGNDFSALHKLAADEMWHFYAGDPLVVHMIDENRRHVEVLLGPDLEDGEGFQALVPAGVWFGSCLAGPDTFALVGCTVSPGFDFADFELAKQSELTALYPEHADLIQKLTRS